jgi:membrane-bound ClpP family serine protease
MPFAVALLCHPAGAYGFAVAAVALLVYAHRSRTFVPAFAGFSCAALTLLAFAEVPPHGVGIALFAAGVMLLHLEFRSPTYGAALVGGASAFAFGSWLMLRESLPPPLSPALRLAVAFAGTLVVLAAVLRAARLHAAAGIDQ